MLVLGPDYLGPYYSRIVQLKNSVVHRLYRCCQAIARFLKIPGDKFKLRADVHVFELTRVSLINSLPAPEAGAGNCLRFD